MPELLAIMFAVASTLIAATGMLFFKLASAGMGTKKMLTSPQFISGGILSVLGTFLFIAALRLDELSGLFPITALTYIWVMLLSRKQLNEPINKWKAGAVLLIVAGIVLATI